MKTTFWILVFIAILVWSAEPHIKLSPFSITFESPLIPFALFFLVLSISLFSIHYKKEGERKGRIEAIEEYYSKAFNDGRDFVIDELKKLRSTSPTDTLE
jgi:hypothetical protein